MTTMLEKELELEQEACDMAREKLEQMLHEAIAEGRADQTAIGKKIVSYNFNTVRQAIVDFVERNLHPVRRRGAESVYVPLMRNMFAAWTDAERDVEELYDIITLATVSTAIAAALDSTMAQNSFSSCSIGITRQILDEIHLYAIGYFDANNGAHERAVQQRCSVKNKQIYVRHMLSTHAEVKIEAQNSVKTALGGAFLYTAIDAGLGVFCQLETVERVNHIVPTKLLIETYNKNADKLLSLAHRFIPMICKPAPWSSPVNGGYHGRLKTYTQLIRLQDCTMQYVTEYQQKLQQLDMSNVYSALNAYQETAYKINTRTLGVLEAVIERGGGIADIARMTPYDEVPPIPEDAPKEVVDDYKKKCRDLIRAEIVRKSHALRIMTTAGAARKYAQYEEIYFPVNMDWRGRLYPIPTALTPQGDDMQKAMLEFAYPAQIKTDEDGVNAEAWLKVQIANCAGKDKLTYDERRAWVDENTDAILRAAKDPMGEGLNDWQDADEPWCFLASCFAYSDMQEYKKKYGTLVGFACGLPCNLDATCSVLQHFASLMHDKNLAKMVNLTNDDKVNDVYGEIAKIVTKKVRNDAVNGTESAMVKDSKGEPYMKLGTKVLAQKWLAYSKATNDDGSDNISRKTTKRCVMTYGYGSPQFGFKETIYEYVIKPYLNKHGGCTGTVFEEGAKSMAHYLAKVIYETVCEEMQGVEQTKAFIQRTVGTALDAGLDVIAWVTPDGLLVQSQYNVNEKRDIFLKVCGKALKVYSNDMTDEVNARKQKQAISPNYIHSRDAAHMRKVLNTCKAEGMNNFMMIHDSFGVECVNIAKLYTILRETFVSLYEGDPLDDFVEDLHYLTPMTQFEAVPAKGEFDVHEVLEAKYAFC